MRVDYGLGMSGKLEEEATVADSRQAFPQERAECS